MCWSLNCSGSEAESWGSWAVLLGRNPLWRGGKATGVSTRFSNAVFIHYWVCQHVRCNKKFWESLITDWPQGRSASQYRFKHDCLITLQMKSVNWRVNLFYWPQRLNQQRCFWLIWGLFVLIKRSFAKALVTGDCCHSLDLVWCLTWAVFHTSSCDLSILGPFLGMEPICDKAGFEQCISWKYVSCKPQLFLSEFMEIGMCKIR